MSLPCTLAIAVVFLTATQTWAQPSPPRESRQREVIVTGDPAAPPVPIHAAKGVATVLVFKARINGAAVKVDREQVKLLDAGDWSLIFEPLVEPGSEQGMLLSVPFVDSKATALAVFTLVSRPREVDTRLDVAWAPPSVERCQAELAEAQARCSKSSLMGFARDFLPETGLVVRSITGCGERDTGAGLYCRTGTVLHGRDWVLVAATLKNRLGEPVWFPGEVTLKNRKTQATLRPLAVEWDFARIEPGKNGRVFVHVAAPEGGELDFTLEVRGAPGHTLVIDGVNLRGEERKP